MAKVDRLRILERGCNSPHIVIEETNGIEWRKVENEYKCSQGKTLIAHGQGNSASINSNFSGIVQTQQ